MFVNYAAFNFAFTLTCKGGVRARVTAAVAAAAAVKTPRQTRRILSIRLCISERAGRLMKLSGSVY